MQKKSDQQNTAFCRSGRMEKQALANSLKQSETAVGGEAWKKMDKTWTYHAASTYV
jgi:hypothetical protein